MVVSRDSFRIAFTLSALNNVEIRAADIGNEYLNAECRENIWKVAGNEFGREKFKVIIVVRALYGLKSYGAAWRQMLDQTLRYLGYVSSQADPDIWLKTETNTMHMYLCMSMIYYTYITILTLS